MKIKIFLMMFMISTAFWLSSCSSISNPLGGEETPELYPIRQNRKWGFINRKGEVVIQPQFGTALPFSEGLAAACLEVRKCGYINEVGKFIINPQFNLASRFSEGLAAVALEDKVGYIDKSGKFVINPQFELQEGVFGTDVNPLSTFSEGLAIVRIGNKAGFIDQAGKIVINPQFEGAIPFSDGLAAVAIGNKLGYIDKTGKIVINPQFEYAQPFFNGLASVRIGTQYGYVDKSGKIVINPQFESASPFSKEGLARVKVGSKIGFVDKEGKLIINPQFTIGRDRLLDSEREEGTLYALAVTSELGRISFSEELAPVQIGDENIGYIGYIDKTGKIVINPQFNLALPFYGGLALVMTDSGMAYIDKEGNYVWRETKETPKTSSNSNMMNSNTMNSNTAVVVDSNSSMSNGSMSNATSSSNQRNGRFVTDANLRSEPNKDSASVGIHFKDAKVLILDETSYERDGAISTWYKIRVTDYGCSRDTNLGCGKNSPNDADEGWVNAKSVLRLF